LVGVVKCLESLSDIVRGLFQRHERMDYSGVSLVLKGPLSLLVMAAVFWMTRDIVAAVAAICVTYLLTFFVYDLFVARNVLGSTDQPRSEYRRVRPRFRTATIGRLVWISLPLGIVMGLITLQISIPRLVLEGFAGAAALGYFLPLVYPIQVGQMVVSALGQSAAPRLARYYVENRAAYRKLLAKLILLSAGLAAAIVLGTLLIGRPVLRVLYGPEYAEHYREFFIIAVAAAVQLFSSAWGYALTSARRFNLQVVLTGASCFATAVVSFALIPRWGIAGAAAAVLMNAIVTAVLFYLAVRGVARAPLPPTPASQTAAAVELQSDAQAATDCT
jgi:O-antigen/teichoic acid export membrane protein